jgi:hypothetical protein
MDRMRRCFFVHVVLAFMFIVLVVTDNGRHCRLVLEYLTSTVYAVLRFVIQQTVLDVADD